MEKARQGFLRFNSNRIIGFTYVFCLLPKKCKVGR